MFIGHFAVGLAAKRLAPRTSLGLLIAAPNWLDLIWPVFLALGVEHARITPGITAFGPLDLYDYPWSHSLVMSLAWSAAAGAAYFAARRDLRAAGVIASLVFSHWVLDFVTHRPDMPLYPGSDTRIGLGLWNSIPGTLIVEGLIFVAGVAIYARSTAALDRRGRYGFWAYVVLLVLLYVGSIVGPPPADIRPLIFGAPLSWLLILIPWWFDRHRRAPEAR